MRPIQLALGTLAAAAAGVANFDASAHGTAGKRFFPATVTIEDPFVADEVALPAFAWTKGGEEQGVTTAAFEFELAKRMTSNVAFSVEGAWVRESGDEGRVTGFENLTIGVKYQMYTDEDAELVLSIGVGAELGGTGSKRLHVAGFDTYAAAFYFGKGFGDLPDSVQLLRPLALTGVVGLEVPADRVSYDEEEAEWGRNPSHVVLGAAIEYSLPYLHANVRDFGLPDWLNQVTPLVELSFSMPSGQSTDDGTTGTISPGFLWSGRFIQVGVEVVFPINHDSGDAVGAAVQLHFALDDVFPESIGAPVFAD